MIHGQCLCGGVQFDIDRVHGPFELCHCNRCRKTSGTAFMAAVGVLSKKFHWICGKELVKSYEAPLLKIPPAYRVTFCSNCGSPVPDPHSTASWFEIPAGLLDGEFSMQPDKHIYVDCKSDWFKISDSLPQLSEIQLIKHRNNLK